MCYVVWYMTTRLILRNIISKFGCLLEAFRAEALGQGSLSATLKWESSCFPISFPSCSSLCSPSCPSHPTPCPHVLMTLVTWVWSSRQEEEARCCSGQVAQGGRSERLTRISPDDDDHDDDAEYDYDDDDHDDEDWQYVSCPVAFCKSGVRRLK